VTQAKTKEASEMSMHERNLAGIGRRFEIVVERGRRIVVIVHHTGERHLYVMDRGEDEPSSSVELTDDQARKVGAILGGAFFKPAVVQEIEDVVGEFIVDWVTLAADSPAVGRSLEDMRVRQETGMSVVAIVRGKRTITGPAPEERFEDHDRLVVVGRHADFPRFVKLVLG
jgi:TrkA domain protein